MTPVVVFVPEAADGVVAARAWYDAHPPRLGRAFAIDLEEAVARILQNPLAFPFVRGGSRQAALKRFPHTIQFRIHHDHVVIVAIVCALPSMSRGD